MNEIIRTIDSCESFEELGNHIQSTDLIQKASNFLNITYETLHRSRPPLKETRLLLAAFLINRFPDDTLGTFNTTGLSISGEVSTTMSPESLALQSKSTEFIEQLKHIHTTTDITPQSAERIVQYFRQFILLFDNWKQSDSPSLKRTLIEEYHHLSVQIMNEQDKLPKTPDATNEASSETSMDTDDLQNPIQQRIEVLEQCKIDLLETAKMFGQDFANEVLQYAPVVIDIEQLCAQYSNAFWDILYEEFVAKKYDKIFVVLEHIIVLFGQIYDGTSQSNVNKMVEIREKIDVAFIRQRLEHNAYSAEDMLALCNFIMVQCQSLQAPTFDAVVDELRANLAQENFLPRFLREISIILQITTTDVLTFREQEAGATDQSNAME